MSNAQQTAARLAKMARKNADAKYGEALRRDFITPRIFAELVVAEAAHIIAAQDVAKYDAARAIIEAASKGL